MKQDEHQGEVGKGVGQRDVIKVHETEHVGAKQDTGA